MATDLVASALSTVVSTIVGGLITLCAGWLGLRISRRSAEVAAMNAVIVELSTRRAFTYTPEGHLSQEAVDDENGPFQTANRSVLEVRSLIKTTLTPLKPGSERAVALLGGFQACNEYLEFAAWNPVEYAGPLNTLTERLANMSMLLSRTSPKKIPLVAPGSQAYPKVLRSGNDR